MQTDNPVEQVTQPIYRFIKQRLGPKWTFAIGVSILLVSAWGFLGFPGSSQLSVMWQNLWSSIPTSNPERISFAIADLHGDHDNVIKRQLLAGINEEFDTCVFEAISVPREVWSGTPFESNRYVEALPRAQEYLTKTGAQVIIWGEVSPSNSARLSLVVEGVGDRQFCKYSFNGNFELPSLFVGDLKTAVIASLYAATANDNWGGQFVADKLARYVEKLERILNNGFTYGTDDSIAVQSLLGYCLQTVGNQQSRTDLLRRAAKIHEKIAILSKERGDTAEFTWSLIQYGIVLQSLGKREIGTINLRRALNQYETVVPLYNCDSVPIDCASLLDNVGNVLSLIYEREDSVNYFIQAKTAYEQSERLCPIDRDSMRWGLIQHNLATLWLNTPDSSNKLGNVKRAIQYLKNALKVRNRTTTPLYWASTMNNLGSAYFNLAEIFGGREPMDSAIRFFDSALFVYDRTKMPLEWSIVEHNLGRAYKFKGEFSRDTTMLQQAMTHFRNALLARTQEDAPFYQLLTLEALAQSNLSFGEIASDTTYLKRAESLYGELSTVYGENDQLLQWATSNYLLAHVCIKRAQLTGNKQLFLRARESLIRSSGYCNRSASPTNWSKIQSELALIEVTLGSAMSDLSRLSLAIEYSDSALLERQCLDFESIASLYNNRGVAQLLLGGLKHDRQVLESARLSFEYSLRASEGIKFALGSLDYLKNATVTDCLLGEISQDTMRLKKCVAEADSLLVIYGDTRNFAYQAEVLVYRGRALRNLGKLSGQTQQLLDALSSQLRAWFIYISLGSLQVENAATGVQADLASLERKGASSLVESQSYTFWSTLRQYKQWRSGRNTISK